MRIAITGGIADGKSTVCALLEEMGHTVVSADDIVHELHTDPTILAKVRDEIGKDYVAAYGIDRDALREALSVDPEVRRQLNEILHPPVMSEVIVRTQTDGLAFAEVPLLIETATQGLFDEVWVVAAGVEMQRIRLIARLGSQEAADALLSTQLPTAAKIPFADRVIRTNEPVETVKSTIARHVEEVKERSLRT